MNIAQATGVAVAVLLFSAFCWICNVLMLWLAWIHNERLSYVACISYFPLLSTTCSIIQQLHDYIWFEDVAIAAWENRIANVGNPTLVICNGCTGIDRILFYIQYYCYNVEATFVLFWAFSLMASVYGWTSKPHPRRIFARINIVGKVTSVVLPLVTVSLLQVEAIQGKMVAFLVIADFQFIISCGGGAIFLLMILAKYVHSRRQFNTWTAAYGISSLTTETDTKRSSFSPILPRPKGIYDKWLVIRFTIAFVALGIFECCLATFQVTGQQNNTAVFLSHAPNLSAEKAIRMSLQDLPGVTASLIPFVVFGTTKQFREKMWTTFVPKRWQKSSKRDNMAFTNRQSMLQDPYSSIRVSKGVAISYSMNDMSPTPSCSNYKKAADDEKPLKPLSPARVPARGPWEDRWEQHSSLHGVRWHVSAGGDTHPSQVK
ncbi:uncharacterized protein JN550_001145 [Neoarthrinium moseri]|uniref:uncharacterized protein n=1 Tax=Neoarthrinium moseri TaxID=1658444 RepID=UPI001FDDA681|nr:uncharacterized protein JN550_001145 [Neoarthrinium moseri]KAI1877073.1 hypothetical protein JN550_001145 [Neoarthrinium moseri]